MDETYIKVKNKSYYLYRTIDSSGLTLDIWLRKKRDNQVAYNFFKRLGKQFGEPKVLVTDKTPSLSCAFKLLRSQGYFISTIHRTSKYLTTITE
ncbi:transposase (fragment) [Carnobacterium maltaromaticum]